MAPLLPHEIDRFVRDALTEDLGTGDVTSLATIPPDATARAAMVARVPLVVAGLDLAAAAFRELSPAVTVSSLVPDGRRAEPGQHLLEVQGPARALLGAERVALNCVQHLSGIATLAAAFVAAVAHTSARILDTRKTLPGWRRLAKYAVACGGALNHRHGLSDLVLIKDNHLAALHDAAPNPVAAAVARARARYPYLRVEVEADTLDQVRLALDARADIVLLDNMSLALLRDAVALCRGRALTEASGGVRLETVRAIAETGVDFISVGALTHSAPAVDVGLDFLP